MALIFVLGKSFIMYCVYADKMHDLIIDYRDVSSSIIYDLISTRKFAFWGHPYL